MEEVGGVNVEKSRYMKERSEFDDPTESKHAEFC